ncbi:MULTISPECIES: hypothetical protein [unclassified Cyanobium]|uniref:hypothetical protein n=1 Tax=unclassified Cyanobium TaxID=2627006 RepID=UPI0020CD60D3|nr:MULTISPECIES: hypothetical protein [unclassified Cyanobium]MCP9861038.1 hypothetical protein [Cyanobium sp. Cruz-8H5]MCP9868237.1 hypothetical protein [Cyanobium sp. Cruz-8D1]
MTQIDYYTERVKRMVGKVLTGNGITTYGDGHDSMIGGDELSDGERDALLELCRQRLDAFREQRGEEVFAHRRGRFVLIAGGAEAGCCWQGAGAATATHLKASATV